MATLRRAFFLALLAVYATFALADERRLDELMEKSGLQKQLVQIEPLMKMGIDEAQADAVARGLKTAMGPKDIVRVKAAISASFAPDVLRANCRDAFAERLGAVEEAQVLEWLSTELGRRVTSLEEGEDHVSASERMRRERAVKDLLPTVAAGRIIILQRLARATLSGEAAANMVINTTVGTSYGVAAATPPLDTTIVDALRTRMEAQRPRMVAYLRELAVADYAYTYRVLSDEELGRYAAFAESPAGRRYHEATVFAMEQAFARGSIQLGLELGRLGVPQERHNS